MTPSSQRSMPDEGQFLNSFYIGINIENILYGIVLFLYFKTIYILLGNSNVHKRSNLFYVLFSSMMVLSITVWVATQAFFGQKMWLIDSDFPGGPNAYWNTNISAWYMVWATVGAFLLQLMTDALMIYRCQIVWNSYRVVVVPILLWLATFALGVLVTWANSVLKEDYQTGLSTQLSLAYWSVSVFLNTTLTCMICYRVMQHGRIVQKCLGREYASLHFSVVTIIVESVLPYTLSGIGFLVSLGTGSPTSSAVICVYLLMMCISPQMLILRVMAGNAWDSETFNQPGISSIKFDPADTSSSGSQLSRSNDARVDIMTLSNVYHPDERDKVRVSEV